MPLDAGEMGVRGRLVADAAVWNEEIGGGRFVCGIEDEDAGVANFGTSGNGRLILRFVLMIGEENGPVGEFQFAGGKVFDANFLVIEDGEKSKVFCAREDDRHEELVALDQKIGGSGIDTQFNDGRDGLGFAVALDG